MARAASGMPRPGPRFASSTGAWECWRSRRSPRTASPALRAARRARWSCGIWTPEEPMRQYRLTKCKRIHGVHFAPDGKRLLAVGGAEVRTVESAVWLDLATGENVGRIDQVANCYAVDPRLTRYALGGANG